MRTPGRRRFLPKSGATLAAVAAASVGAPHVIAQPKVQWRLSTAYPAAREQHGAALRLAKVVGEMSGGRFIIEIFPGGQIMSPFECPWPHDLSPEQRGLARATANAVQGQGRADPRAPPGDCQRWTTRRGTTTEPATRVH